MTIVKEVLRDIQVESSACQVGTAQLKTQFSLFYVERTWIFLIRKVIYILEWNNLSFKVDISPFFLIKQHA